jgi:UDP-N-acetylglucosamine 2-epimerase (non-hydrolysing)
VPHPIAVCLGSRPEVLRLAPVIHEMRRRDVPAVAVTLGPHRATLDRMLATFEIDAHPAPAGAPHEAVVVQADTPTSTWATRAAVSRGVPVARVEAGVHTAGEDGRHTARLATWHFAPSETARGNLLREGIDPSAIEVTAGTVAEAARWIAERDGLLGRPPVAGPRRVLVAAGARGGAAGTGRMLARLAERADVELVLPVARSTRVRAAAPAELAAHDNVALLDALGYDDFVAALAASHLVLSDAADVREAAAALGVPALTLGGSAPATTLQQVERLLDDDALHAELAAAPAAGGAARRIVARLAGDLAATGVHSGLLAA